MNKKTLFFIAMLIAIGYYIYRMSKKVVDNTKTISDPALAEVMPDSPDLH